MANSLPSGPPRTPLMLTNQYAVDKCSPCTTANQLKLVSGEKKRGSNAKREKLLDKVWILSVQNAMSGVEQLRKWREKKWAMTKQKLGAEFNDHCREFHQDRQELVMRFEEMEREYNDQFNKHWEELDARYKEKTRELEARYQLESKALVVHRDIPRCMKEMRERRERQWALKKKHLEDEFEKHREAYVHERQELVTCYEEVDSELLEQFENELWELDVRRKQKRLELNDRFVLASLVFDDMRIP